MKDNKDVEIAELRAQVKQKTELFEAYKALFKYWKNQCERADCFISELLAMLEKLS